MRIEDTDRERNVPGMSDNILYTLQAMALKWDKDVIFQSKREDIYKTVVEDLLLKGLAYHCSCSRKDIGGGRGRGVDGAIIYPGTCKSTGKREGIGSVRFCVQNKLVGFEDLRMGKREQNVFNAVGDFVIYRADKCFAYHPESRIKRTP